MRTQNKCWNNRVGIVGGDYANGNDASIYMRGMFWACPVSRFSLGENFIIETVVCVIEKLRGQMHLHGAAQHDVSVENGQTDTDPSSLSIHMCGSDVLSQVGAVGEQHLAVVPAAGVAQRLAPCRCWAAHCCHASTVTVEHGRGWATAGSCTVHVHYGWADAGKWTQESFSLVLSNALFLTK